MRRATNKKPQFVYSIGFTNRARARRLRRTVKKLAKASESHCYEVVEEAIMAAAKFQGIKF